MFASRRGWIAPGAIATIMIFGLLAFGVWSRPSTDRARLAYERGDWPSASSIAARVLEREPGDLEAIRLRSRSLARLDQAGEAYPLAAKLGGPKVEAEDLWLIGRVLLKDNRSALGWIATDAATRLDSKHTEAAEAFARLSRTSRAPARADRLSAIPSSPALSELIVGLAALSHGTGGDALLDRILTHDRATFRKVDSPDAARKFLARTLMEGGRAAEAREWLGKLDRHDDLEAHWLLGRAYLAGGDAKNARIETDRAGTFGLDNLMAHEPSRYVGAKQCAGCHNEIYQSQQSSNHAGTVTWGDGLKAVPLPRGPVTDPGNPEVVHRFDRSGPKIELSTTVAGKEIADVIDYALGSGHHGVTMLAREKDGSHRMLRMSYYSGGEHWDLTNGSEEKPVDPALYVGQLLSEDGFRSCLNCHTTRFTSERDRGGPEVADHGIGCARCHGPGENHLQAIRSSFDQPAIARPRLATPAQRLKLCAECHSADGVIPPSDPRFIRFQASTLPYSRCVTESGGKLDCVACHDPHRNVETSPAYYEARCLACHADSEAPRTKSPGFHVEAVASKPCPVNASTGCLTCHMPKVEKIMPFMTFTDHHIRVHRPAGKADNARGPR